MKNVKLKLKDTKKEKHIQVSKLHPTFLTIQMVVLDNQNLTFKFSFLLCSPPLPLCLC